jgi:hypothetical protein
LKGHKEDSAYQKWDEQYVEWLEMKNELQIETEWRIEQFFATEEK